MPKQICIKKSIIIITILLVIFSSYNSGKSELKSGFHPDEFLYAYYAGLFKSFIDRNFDNVCWKSKFKYHAVPAGVYWIGLTLYFSKYKSLLVEPKKVWVLKGPDFENQISSYQKSHPLPHITNTIYVLREKMLIYRVFLSLLLFIFAFCLGGYWCAVLTTYLLLQSKQFLWISNLVMLETIWLFQHILNLLLIYLYFLYQKNHPNNKAVINLLMVLIAVSAGLLMATKISGALNILVLTIYFFYHLVQENRSGLLKMRKALTEFLQIIFIVLLSITVFIIVNPALYDNTVSGIKNIFTSRLHILNQQIALQPELHLPSLASRLNFIKDFLRLGLTEVVFFVFGILFLFLKIKRSFMKNNSANFEYLTSLVFFSLTAATLIFMKLAYKRYALTLLPYIYLIISYGIVSIIKEVLLKAKKVWFK